MSERLHIIIAGDKGNVRNLLMPKRLLQITCLFSICLFLVLAVTSYKAFFLFQTNTELNEQLSCLSSQLNEKIHLKEQLALQVDNLQQLNSRQAETFQKEKTTLLNAAVTELEERSNMIERIISNIGLDVPAISTDSNNSGGPFIASRDSREREVLFRSNRYLKSITYLPLGRPIPGPVTSRFGHRTDPLNGKKGFHTGVDMRGHSGQKIIATADGVVKKAYFNASYGRYIEIDHGNGYLTKFAHLKKMLVKQGEHIKRGQNIGIVGSSGRSTGPHLHYEICLDNKPVNPSKFMRVDKLTQAPVITKLTAKSRIKIKHSLVTTDLSPTVETSKN